MQMAITEKCQKGKEKCKKDERQSEQETGKCVSLGDVKGVGG